MDANTARLKAARLEKEAAAAREVAREAHRRSAAGFFDNIDTSGGPDACHPWTGACKWNHPEGAASRFKQGLFHDYQGCDSFIATRVLCFATYGRNVPPDLDVMPLCGDHTCCNTKHLCITPHGGQETQRFAKAVTVEDFFNEPTSSAAGCRAAA